MTKEELKNICKTLPLGAKLKVTKKTVYMGKYGNSRKFIPRNVAYKPVEMIFESLSDDGEYLNGTENECFYYSKIGKIELLP